MTLEQAKHHYFFNAVKNFRKYGNIKIVKDFSGDILISPKHTLPLSTVESIINAAYKYSLTLNKRS